MTPPGVPVSRNRRARSPPTALAGLRRHALGTRHRPRAAVPGQLRRKPKMAAVVPSESQTPAATAWQFGVHSEVGKLRRVMIHRPDLELKRLTPNNHDDLLFDDVLWVRRARQQHDAFARPAARPRHRGRSTSRTLLAETLAGAGRPQLGPRPGRDAASPSAPGCPTRSAPTSTRSTRSRSPTTSSAG